jgi:hypothetical protein
MEDTGMLDPNAAACEDPGEAAMELKRAAAHCLIDWEAVEDLHEAARISAIPSASRR